MKKVLPDFNNSLINITSSIKKKFGSNYSIPTLFDVDEKIKDKKHVIVLLLDGLGINILENLSPDSFLRRHLVRPLTSIFPPTTAAATTSFLQGVLPGQSGWFGWHQYFSDLDKDLVLFLSADYYTEERVNPMIRDKYLRHHEFGYDLNCEYQTLMPAFAVGGFETLKSMLNYALKITQREDKSYTYCYWDNPDALIHEFGCHSRQVKEFLIKTDKEIELFASKKNDDTEVIVIADHGLIDVEAIRLDKYSDVNDCLIRKPSLECRSTVYFVKEDKKEEFEKNFNRHFSKWFELYKTDDFINTGLFGQVNEEYRHFLGDYISVAIDKYYITVKDEAPVKAFHAGMCEEEMMIPLIMF